MRWSIAHLPPPWLRHWFMILSIDI